MTAGSDRIGQSAQRAFNQNNSLNQNNYRTPRLAAHNSQPLRNGARRTKCIADAT